MKLIDWTMEKIDSKYFRVAALLATIFIGLLNIVDFVLSYKIWHIVKQETKIELSCQPDTNDYRALIFGRWEGGELDDILRFYVSPKDGTNKYWLQDTEAEMNHDTKLFSSLIVLGNPSGRWHEKTEWPIVYEVYAFLVKKEDEQSIPGIQTRNPGMPFTNQRNFIKSLQMLSRTYAKCSITRHEPCNIPQLKGLDVCHNTRQGCHPQVIEGNDFKLSWDDQDIDRLNIKLSTLHGQVLFDNDIGKNEYVINQDSGYYILRVRQAGHSNSMCESVYLISLKK